MNQQQKKYLLQRIDEITNSNRTNIYRKYEYRIATNEQLIEELFLNKTAFSEMISASKHPEKLRVLRDNSFEIILPVCGKMFKDLRNRESENYKKANDKINKKINESKIIANKAKDKIMFAADDECYNILTGLEKELSKL